jgi:hypothetical protein
MTGAAGFAQSCLLTQGHTTMCYQPTHLRAQQRVPLIGLIVSQTSANKRTTNISLLPLCLAAVVPDVGEDPPGVDA